MPASGLLQIVKNAAHPSWKLTNWLAGTVGRPRGICDHRQGAVAPRQLALASDNPALLLAGAAGHGRARIGAFACTIAT